MPYKYANMHDTVFSEDAALIESRLGYIVYGSRSTGTGTSPCSWIILIISEILIPVIIISEPCGNFLHYKQRSSVDLTLSETKAFSLFFSPNVFGTNISSKFFSNYLASLGLVFLQTFNDDKKMSAEASTCIAQNGSVFLGFIYLLGMSPIVTTPKGAGNCGKLSKSVKFFVWLGQCCEENSSIIR